MAIISVRFNAEEEKMVTYLAEEYEKDKSSRIKYSLKQMYEDSIDKRIIEEYEKNEGKKKNNFIKAEEIFK
jgi:hypothetical protein